MKILIPILLLFCACVATAIDDSTPPISVVQALEAQADLPIGNCSCDHDSWCCQPPGWPEVCSGYCGPSCDPRDLSCWPDAVESSALDATEPAAALDEQLTARHIAINPDMRIACDRGADGWTECCATTQTCSICSSCYAGVCRDTSHGCSAPTTTSERPSVTEAVASSIDPVPADPTPDLRNGSCECAGDQQCCAPPGWPMVCRYSAWCDNCGAMPWTCGD